MRNLSFAGRLNFSNLFYHPYLHMLCKLTFSLCLLCGSIDRKVRDFVWGNTNNSRKIHLLSCYRICCPTLQGGLGLRSAREVNLAFIMKVSWGICTHNDDLWAQLLKSKCMVHSQCSQTLKVALIGGEGFSQLELCWVEDHMEAWNGLKARFWLDPWLPD